MPVYRIYYILVERNYKNVSGIWRILHLWMVLIAGLSGIVCVWFFYIILQAFNHNCALYAKIEFSLLSPDNIGYNILPQNVTVNLRESNWGNDLYCQYCFTTWMTSFLCGILLMTFFLWSKGGGVGERNDSFVQPWKHILPTLILSIIFSVATTLAALFSIEGLHAFCHEFKPYIINFHCDYRIDAFSLPFATKVLKLYQAMLLVQSASPVCVVAWIFSTVMVLIRICISPDFYVQVLRITSIESYINRRKPVEIEVKNSHPTADVSTKNNIPSTQVREVRFTNLSLPSVNDKSGTSDNQRKIPSSSENNQGKDKQTQEATSEAQSTAREVSRQALKLPTKDGKEEKQEESKQERK